MKKSRGNKKHSRPTSKIRNRSRNRRKIKKNKITRRKSVKKSVKKSGGANPEPEPEPEPESGAGATNIINEILAATEADQIKFVSEYLLYSQLNVIYPGYLFAATKDDLGSYFKMTGVDVPSRELSDIWINELQGSGHNLRIEMREIDAEPGLKYIAEGSAKALFGAIKRGINSDHRIMGSCDFVATLVFTWAIFRNHITVNKNEYISIFDNPFSNGPEEVNDKGDVEVVIAGKLKVLYETDDILAFVTIFINGAGTSHHFIIVRQGGVIYIYTTFTVVNKEPSDSKMIMKHITIETLGELCQCQVSFLKVFQFKMPSPEYSFICEGIGIYNLN